MNKETLQVIVQLTILYSSFINTANFAINVERHHHKIQPQNYLEQKDICQSIGSLID